MKNEMSTVVSRQFFADLVSKAAASLSEKTKSRELFAAPLAGRVRDLLRISLADPDVSITGSFFGPVLFPNLSPTEHSVLKFRHFLESFPELLETIRLPSGDKVRILNPPDRVNGVHQPAVLGVAQPQRLPATAYLIIDSASFLATLHLILAGEKPGPKTLPNWEQLRRFLQQQFPAKEWKSRFIMAVMDSQGDGTDSFKAYLETVGFVVLQFSFDSQPTEMEEIIKERSRISAHGTHRLLSQISTSGIDADVFVVTQTASVAPAIQELLVRKRERNKVAVIGFPEHMEAGLLRLRENGLEVIDIEKDAKVFKSILPRRHLISANDFDPAKFL